MCCNNKLSWGILKFLNIYIKLSKNVYVYYICITFLNIHKHIHSVSDRQVKKIQTITILTDNKTKFGNIEKL